MKKFVLYLMLFAALVSILPADALAAGASISLGGKIGFMYENTDVVLRPRLKNVPAEQLQWRSSNDSVALVSDGRITAVNVGRVVITASAGNTSARCGVVVLPREIELEAGKSLQLPYGTVEKYAVQNKQIVNVSEKGLVTAKRAGSSYIRVRYGKQNLYIRVKVMDDQNAVKQSIAAELECAKETSQIVLVEYESGSRANLSIHEKKAGVWKQLYECTAYLGRNGIGKMREGDGKTPIGTYNLTQPFGIKADPGANMDYTKVSRYHYWCGTSGSEYYNQMIDMRQIDRKYTSNDEYLIKFGSVYNYCMFIDYNKNGTAGKGSCIFLHCTGNKTSTAGCIAVPETVMKKIIQWAKPGAKIVIR